jgi:hypothetical protein
MNKTAKIVRWLARILSAFILLFWGWFILGHLFGEAGRSSGPRVTNDYLGLTAMGISLLGLAVAWKWELTGAVMALVGYVVLGVVNWRALGGLYILWPIAAVLFLSSWWMHRAAGRRTASDRLM